MVSDMLRSTLGFQGVVVTDYLDDSAITDRYSSAEAAVAAIQAGADLLLSPEDYQEAYEGVLQAVTFASCIACTAIFTKAAAIEASEPAAHRGGVGEQLG